MSEVSIRDYLESLVNERAARFQAMIQAHEAAHKEADKRIDVRLEQLNDLRSEVMTDRGQFVNREMFDTRLQAIDMRIDVLHDQVTEWRGRGQGLSLVASIVVGAVGAVGVLLAVYFALTG